MPTERLREVAEFRTVHLVSRQLYLVSRKDEGSPQTYNLMNVGLAVAVGLFRRH